MVNQANVDLLCGNDATLSRLVDEQSQGCVSAGSASYIGDVDSAPGDLVNNAVYKNSAREGDGDVRGFNNVKHRGCEVLSKLVDLDVIRAVIEVGIYLSLRYRGS